MDPTSFPQPTDRIAYLGRVSTPKQKLEHQREAVLRFAEQNGLNIPQSLRFEDKVRRHKQLAEGDNFKRLMSLVESRQVDWIVIATFDRWGITDIEDISIIRKKLKQYDVRLWSVADELNITGTDDGTFWRVAARAEGATAYVGSQAEKNIQKMVTMAQQGWAASGNAPFGLDLVCYPLNDLTRPMFRVVRQKYIRPQLFKILWYDKNGKVEKEEISEHMPPRDKKATGYRQEPSVEKDRLQAVRLMFELYMQGMGFSAISKNLWEQGYKHYDRPFGYHGIETILSNSAYIGMPAWGKNGVGQYRHAINKTAAKIKRKSTDTLTVKKTEDQFIYPLKQLFDPVVDPDLFQRVKVKLETRGHVNPSFGKRRTREKTRHPLNGKLTCPDCNERMVLGSYTPRGKKKSRCFHCGTWRKTLRTKCFSNTVSWAKLDAATDELLLAVADRIEAVEQGDFARLKDEVWLRETDLGKVIFGIVAKAEAHLNSPEQLERFSAIAGFPITEGPSLLADLESACDAAKKRSARPILEFAFAIYEHKFETDAVPLRKELEAIEDELEGVALELPKQRNKVTIYNRLDRRAKELELRKAEIVPLTIPMTEKAKDILRQLAAIKKTIRNSDKSRKADLLDTFVEQVSPIFEVRICNDGVRRAYVKGFRFVPKKEAKHIMPQAMEFGYSRTDKDSSQRPASGSRGKSGCPRRD